MARRAILTLPKPLLAQLGYDPPLPAAGDSEPAAPADGIGGQGQRDLRTASWRRRSLNGQVLSDTGPIRLTYDNSPPDGRPSVPGGTIEGDDSRRFYGASASVRRHAALQALARFFGRRPCVPLPSTSTCPWPVSRSRAVSTETSTRRGTALAAGHGRRADRPAAFRGRTCPAMAQLHGRRDPLGAARGAGGARRALGGGPRQLAPPLSFSPSPPARARHRTHRAGQANSRSVITIRVCHGERCARSCALIGAPDARDRPNNTNENATEYVYGVQSRLRRRVGSDPRCRAASARRRGPGHASAGVRRVVDGLDVGHHRAGWVSAAEGAHAPAEKRLRIASLRCCRSRADQRRPRAGGGQATARSATGSRERPRAGPLRYALRTRPQVSVCRARSRCRRGDSRRRESAALTVAVDDHDRRKALALREPRQLLGHAGVSRRERV